MVPPHYYLGTSCLYCGATGAGPGAPCLARFRRERERPHLGPYDPVQALKAAVFALAWPRVGSVRVEVDHVQEGPTGRTRVRVLHDGQLVAEAREVGLEAAARAARERLAAPLKIGGRP
jgi:hypothetical protein